MCHDKVNNLILNYFLFASHVEVERTKWVGNGVLCMFREALVSEPFPVVWIDNFSKNMARQIPRLGKDVFTSMMWTGLALKLYDGPELSRGLVEDDGQVVPAMPPIHAPPKDDFVRFVSASMHVDCANPVPMRYSQAWFAATTSTLYLPRQTIRRTWTQF